MLTTEQAIKANDYKRLTLQEFYNEFEKLGYRIDRSMDCYSNNKFMTGDFAGESYAAINTGVKEADTGRSAYNIESRRDENYRAMQELRSKICAVVKGRILEA